MDAEAKNGIAPALAVMGRRAAAVVDVRDRIQRPRGVAILDATGDGGSASRGERADDSCLEDSRDQRA